MSVRCNSVPCFIKHHNKTAERLEQQLRHIRNRATTTSSTAYNTPGLRRISALNLREAVLSARRPIPDVISTIQHRETRHWCLRWRCVCFSDECRFMFRYSGCRMHVHKMRVERYAPCCMHDSVVAASCGQQSQTLTEGPYNM